ncbi:hypothetical protein OEA41_003219 [Lepraria neglecta]|uniref:Uncharacterized protein n=1 Tax=Lepraria neglecta TaxID=209136 RepID=A0AAD9Z4A3_9LECA|nr:hypothetical protein OEA41_003219 [Lepraria neglecta]
MPSLLLVVFVLQLLIHLVNTVGAPVINEFLWTLYNKLPTSTSAEIKSQSMLAREVLRLKRELNATSAQDQFAKWAKLDREHNRVQAKYDEKGKKPPFLWIVATFSLYMVK